MVSVDHVLPFLAVAGLKDAKSLAFEHDPQPIAKLRVVIDDEDGF
jgi:hypothetical protein